MGLEEVEEAGDVLEEGRDGVVDGGAGYEPVDHIYGKVVKLLGVRVQVLRISYHVFQELLEGSESLLGDIFDESDHSGVIREDGRQEQFKVAVAEVDFGLFHAQEGDVQGLADHVVKREALWRNKVVDNRDKSLFEQVNGVVDRSQINGLALLQEPLLGDGGHLNIDVHQLELEENVVGN